MTLEAQNLTCVMRVLSKIQTTAFNDFFFNTFDDLIRSKAKGALQSVEYLDLSKLDIAVIEKLNSCPKLETLILRANHIYEVSNLEFLHQLWNIDLSNNELKSLDGLSRFVALGSVNLANNDLTWHELGKIRHIHILNLSMHGNSQMEKDPYYRVHMVDCLPNVWMLDGRIITSAERLQVKHFFQDSALTEKPIRHKLSKDWFIPTALKKIEVNGIYGDKATHMMRRFPTNGAQNVETDKRRLKYLGYNIQEDLAQNSKYTKREFQVLKYRKTFLEDILDARFEEKERCNMLLMLLVASLEFVMPTHLVKETLDTTKLSRIGKVYTMDLFLLPRDVRCVIVCVLLGAVKIDKDEKEDGGLYDKLYLCLFYTVTELTKLSHSTNTKQSAIKSKLNTLYRDYKCLLASEIVQLLCIVPAFFEYVTKDVGVLNLVITATGDPLIMEKITMIKNSVIQEGEGIKRLYEELSDLLLQKVQEQSINISNKTAKMSHSDQILTSKKALPMKVGTSVEMSEFHTKGVTSPDKDPPRVLSAKKVAAQNRKRFPRLGDFLLLGPQTLGKVVSLPQPFVALVAMDSVPVANGAMESKLKTSEDHYTYVNMDQLDFDPELKFWKPRGAIGDRLIWDEAPQNELTMHTIEDLQKELEMKANMADKVPRPNSPNWSVHGRENTPLIYSPRHHSHTPPETPKPKSGQASIPPRPMSSLLKDKLDIDWTRRAKSAGGALDRSNRSESPSGKSFLSQIDVDDSETVNELADEEAILKPSGSDCLQCALEAAISSEKKDEVSGEKMEEKHKRHDHQHNKGDAEADKQQEEKRDPTLNVKTAEETKESEYAEQKEEEAPKQPLFPKPHSINEPYGRNKPRPTQNLAVTGAPLQIQVPSGEDMSKSEPSTQRGTTSSRPQSHRAVSGKKIQSTRPYSAMDAYKYIVAHPIKPNMDNVYNTSYQRQRTEAWKQTAAAKKQKEEIIKVSVVSNGTACDEGRRKSPPPQRPSSPAAIIRIQSSKQVLDEPPSRPTSAALHVKAGTDWLAGGRDLFWESLQRRPRSGHIPGWKEGLPDNMKRPKSAASARHSRIRVTTPVTPSSLVYESMLHGHPTPRDSLPELTDLSDYPSFQQVSVPRVRILGSPQPGHSDFYTEPQQDTIYSNPPCSPLFCSPKLNVYALQQIPESSIDDTITEYLYSLYGYF